MYAQISVDEFIKEANTFDLLLYNSDAITAKATRAYTSSHWDHVGMVYRLSDCPDEVFIFETKSIHVFALF